MKKTLMALIALGLAVANASAITYSDTETSKSGMFDILAFGYNSQNEAVYDAYADFVFSGSGGWLTIGGSQNWITSGGRINLFGSTLLDLQDGRLSYVSSLQSLTAKLTARAGTRNGVPDGGATLLLLGLAFFVILGVQRWKFASAS
jgi:VPDSG-CTERM motif